MEKQGKLLYAFNGLKQALQELVTGSGSKTKRLDNAFVYGLAHWLNDDKYLKAMSQDEAEILVKLRKIISDISTKFDKKYQIKSPLDVRPLQYIHYKKADEIINLILLLYEKLHSDIYSLKN